MKLERIKNTKNGVMFGLIERFVGLILPFIIQTITIKQLGIEYVGVKGLFSSILTVFSLAELGFGSAIVYAMYKPIAEDNNIEISALLNFYRKVYRRIGFFIFILGILIMPFLHFIIDGPIPKELDIHIIFFLYLINVVMSYWTYAFRSSLLYAFQRNDIIYLISLVMLLFSSALQIFVLILFKNYYYFLCISIIFTILQNLIIAFITIKLYPDIKCKGEISKETFDGIKKRVVGLLIGKICGTTRNTFDSIFLAAFLGLIQTAMYTNYYYVITALNGITIVLLNSLLGGVGNCIVMEKKEKNFRDMMLLNNIYMVLCGVGCSFMICLYQPFIRFWVGEEYMFSNAIMLMFPIYFYLLKMGDIRGVYSDAAGLFWENRWRCLLEAIANILLNYFLGRKFGVFGIMTATILTIFFIGFLGSTIVIFKYYFIDGIKKYLLNQGFLMCATLICSSVSYLICYNINLCNVLITLWVRGIVCFTISISIYWIILHKTKSYKDCKEFILRVFKSKY